MFIVESLGAVEVIFLEEADFARKGALSNIMADPVVDRVTQDSGGCHHNIKNNDIELKSVGIAAGGQVWAAGRQGRDGPGCKKERVAGQERDYNQPRFNKNHQE